MEFDDCYSLVGILSLPPEALFLVGSFLDDNSLCQLAQTCRLLRDFVYDDAVWRPLLARRWNARTLDEFWRSRIGRGTNARHTYALLESRARRCRPYARPLLEEMELSMSHQWHEFPPASGLTAGRVRTFWNIFDNADRAPTVVGFYTQMTIQKPSQVVISLLADLAVLPRWDRIMISCQRLAPIEDGLDAVCTVMPHKTMVQLWAQDRAPGVHRLAVTSNGPSGLLDFDGNEVVFGITAPQFTPECLMVLEELKRGPEHREIIERAMSCPGGSWTMLPTGFIVRDIDDESCSVSHVFKMDIKIPPNTHMAYRLCGMRTLVCHNLIKLCEEHVDDQPLLREEVMREWHARLSTFGMPMPVPLPTLPAEPMTPARRSVEAFLQPAFVLHAIGNAPSLAADDSRPPLGRSLPAAGLCAARYRQRAFACCR
eukprot:TRINITY_DN19251_c0_g1_i1.p1 TRINITY_DN19251_c0_g1~~TRINITY_DN19251_c0_g1_i1.p1  ORF type:complete len:428 (-),score=83.79 TRINITY_DN19251_c0_g1_i1:16-1299(-)